MFKFRKKPVVIEAVQLSSLEGDKTCAAPRWLFEAIASGVVTTEDKDTFINTLEGTMLVGEDDFIIRGVQGELYPCKPDIFNATYEKV